MKVLLRDIAYARSGDKGSHVNIGLIANSEKDYQFLQKKVTVELLKNYFSSLKPSKIIRYEMPNLLAFNIVLKNVLDGGGSRCLRMDSQGKTLGQALLNLEIDDE